MSISNKDKNEMADSLKELNDMMGDIQGSIDKVTEEISKSKEFIDERQMSKLQKEITSIHDWSKEGGFKNSDTEVQEGEAFTPDMFDTTPDSTIGGDTNDNAQTILNTMFDLIEATPNNMELGKRIRNMYHDLVTMSEEEPSASTTENSNQMELF